MSANPHTLGPALMALSMALYVANDATVKFLGSSVGDTLGGSLPLGAIIVWRGVFIITLLLVLILLLPGHGPRALRWTLRKPVLIRSAWDAAVTFCYLAALMHMPLANILAIMNLSPLLILPLAAWRLGEPLRAADMLAVLAGLIGAWLVVRPGPEGFNAFALLALAAATAAALRDISTRHIPADAPTLSVTLSNMLLVQAGGLLLWLTHPALPASTAQWGLLALAAMLLGGAIATLIASVRIAPLRISAPWRYSIIIWGVLAGWLVFGHVPDAFTMLGIGIILASSLHATLRRA